MSTINDIIREALEITKNIDNTPNNKNMNSNFTKNDPTPINNPKHLNGGHIKSVQYNNEHTYKSGIGQSNIRK